MADFQEAQDGLNALVAQLWAIAQGKRERQIFPVRIVDDPETIRAVLAAPERFRKNYDFLEAFASGRFTRSGADWTGRVAMTQPSYARNPYLSGAMDAEAIYATCFADLSGATPHAVGAAAVDAAVRIVSHVFGLREIIAWDPDWNEAVRSALTIRQWVGFAGTSPANLDAVDHELENLRRICESRWRSSHEVQRLIADFAERGEGIAGFEPLEELIQNVIASSETTAASLLWAVAVLARRPALQSAVRDQSVTAEAFVAELLRMYPPVPFVTRYAVASEMAGSESFAAGEAFAISILGLHYGHHWQEAMVFDPSRFADGHGRHRDHYLPFLSGPRACGGRRLAELELVSAVRTLVERYDLSIPEHSEILFDYGLSLRPRISGLQIKARPGVKLANTRYD